MFYDSVNDRIELNSIKQDNQKFVKDIQTLRKDFAALQEIKRKVNRPIKTNLPIVNFPESDLSPIAMKVQIRSSKQNLKDRVCVAIKLNYEESLRIALKKWALSAKSLKQNTKVAILKIIIQRSR